MAKINKAVFKKGFETIKKFFVKNAPELCIGAGIAGGVATTVIAVKETPKAMAAIEKEKEKQGLGNDEKLSVKDTIKVAGPYYIKPAVTGVSSAASILTGAHIYRKRNASQVNKIIALETALAGAQAGADVVRDELVSRIGEEATTEIFEKALNKENEVVQQQNEVLDQGMTRRQVVSTGTGDILYFDPETYTFFRSSEEAMYTAAAKTNAKLHGSMDGTASLADFYYFLGLPTAKAWEDKGWNLQAYPHGHDGTGPVNPILTGRMIRAPWGEAAIVVGFESDPIPEYDRSDY